MLKYQGSRIRRSILNGSTCFTSNAVGTKFPRGREPPRQHGHGDDGHASTDHHNSARVCSKSFIYVEVGIV